jgi:hypothetical protein
MILVSVLLSEFLQATTFAKSCVFVSFDSLCLIALSLGGFGVCQLERFVVIFVAVSPFPWGETNTSMPENTTASLS